MTVIILVSLLLLTIIHTDSKKNVVMIQVIYNYGTIIVMTIMIVAGMDIDSDVDIDTDIDMVNVIAIFDIGIVTAIAIPIVIAGVLFSLWLDYCYCFYWLFSSIVYNF